jgi:hypothetical protein
LAEPIAQALDAFFADHTPERYRRLREAAVQLSPDATRITPEGCRAFAAELAGAAA